MPSFRQIFFRLMKVSRHRRPGERARLARVHHRVRPGSLWLALQHQRRLHRRYAVYHAASVLQPQEKDRVVWSPDGRWIAVSVAGQSTGLEIGTGGDIPLAERLFVFDANVENHELGGEILDDTPLRFRVRAYCFQNRSRCGESLRPVFVGGGVKTL